MYLTVIERVMSVKSMPLFCKVMYILQADMQQLCSLFTIGSIFRSSNHLQLPPTLLKILLISSENLAVDPTVHMDDTIKSSSISTYVYQNS